MRTLTSGLAILALFFCLSADVAAQSRRSGPDTPPPAVIVGAYAGWDTFFREPMAGAKVRLAVPEVDFLSVQGSGDLTFLPGLTERQGTVDLLFTSGGFAVGGGVVYRNTLWDPAAGRRETRTGWSGVVSLGGVPMGRSPFSLGIDYRIVRVGGFRPSPLSISVTMAPFRLLR